METEKQQKVVKFYYNMSRLLESMKEYQEHLSVVQMCENKKRSLQKNEDGLPSMERDEQLKKWADHQEKSQAAADATMAMATECYDFLESSFKLN